MNRKLEVPIFPGCVPQAIHMLNSSQPEVTWWGLDSPQAAALSPLRPRACRPPWLCPSPPLPFTAHPAEVISAQLEEDCRRLAASYELKEVETSHRTCRVLCSPRVNITGTALQALPAVTPSPAPELRGRKQDEPGRAMRWEQESLGRRLTQAGESCSHHHWGRRSFVIRACAYSLRIICILSDLNLKLFEFLKVTRIIFM